MLNVIKKLGFWKKSLESLGSFWISIEKIMQKELSKGEQICRDCRHRLSLENSTKIMEDFFEKNNPLVFVEGKKQSDIFCEILEKYFNEFPEIRKKINPKIDELNEKRMRLNKKIDELFDYIKKVNDNRDYPVGNVVASNITDSIDNQTEIQLKMEIDRVADERNEIDEELQSTKFFISDKDDESESKTEEQDSDHMKILKTRYAKGEITREEFEQMKKDLS